MVLTLNHFLAPGSAESHGTQGRGLDRALGEAQEVEMPVLQQALCLSVHRHPPRAEEVPQGRRPAKKEQ